MRICWFNDNRLGLVKGDRVFDVSKALEKLPKPTYPVSAKGDPLIAHLDAMQPGDRGRGRGRASIAGQAR